MARNTETWQMLFIIIFVFGVKNCFSSYTLETQIRPQNDSKLTNYHSSILQKMCNRSNYLENGVCKNEGYKAYILPSRNLTILVSLKHQYIHSVDDKINSFSMDVEVVLYWIDPGITSTFSYSDKSQGYIPLSIRALKGMWTPELYIYNLSDYKTFIDSQHVSSAKILYNNTYFKNTDVGVSVIEYKIEFKAPVYCVFDFRGYPSDKSSCHFIFGSQYENIQYIYVDKELPNNHSITGLHDCKLRMTNTSLLDKRIFKNSIGLEIEITRIMRPFIYRYFLPCIGFVVVSSLSITLPTSALQARVGLSVTVLLMTVNLYVTQLVRTIPLFNFTCN